MTLVLAITAAAAFLWATTCYNRLLELSDDAQDAWRRMASHLNRRHDLVHELVRELTDVADFDPDILTTAPTVTANARQTLQRANPNRGVRSAARAQMAVSEVLATLKVLLARYPDWHPRRRIHVLLGEITDAEQAATDALRAYNDAAMEFNNHRSIPGWTWVAALAAPRAAETWPDLIHTSSGPALAIEEYGSAPSRGG